MSKVKSQMEVVSEAGDIKVVLPDPANGTEFPLLDLKCLAKVEEMLSRRKHIGEVQ